MRNYSLTLLIALSGTALAGDFIRQIQTVSNTPVISDIPVSSDSGQVMSRALTADAAVFQLYVTETGANNVQTIRKLDEKTVGTYLPLAKVEALSEDPYFPARTRADRPYGIKVTISGIQAAAANVPAYTRNVMLSRSYKLYDSTTYLATSNGGTYADSFNFTGNGTFTASGILQQLPGNRPTKACGEESFTALIQPTSSGPFSEIAKTTVQIWPVADTTITELVQNKVYRDLPPRGSIVIRDLYPKSVTYAQLYRGPQVTGKTGTPLPSTIVSYDTYAPQNVNLALTDLNPLLELDGQYTLEVLTITPFNGGAPELLTSVSFYMKRGISVNSMVSTMK